MGPCISRDRAPNTDGMPIEEFAIKYSASRRETEIKLLASLLENISSIPDKFWMITLVNKQDLWWPARKEVRLHYEVGEYGQRIEDFRAKFGVDKFQHEFVPASLSLGNLTSQSGELVMPTAAGYDTNIRVRHLRSFFDRFHSLIEDGIPE